jgi:hypothetical protein
MCSPVSAAASPANPLLFVWCAALAGLALLTGAQLLAESVRAWAAPGGGGPDR